MVLNPQPSTQRAREQVGVPDGTDDYAAEERSVAKLSADRAQSPRCFCALLRNEEIACIRRETTLETAASVKAYKTKRQGPCDARIVTRGEAIEEEQGNNELLQESRI
ncbi:hypothetical protein GEV33_006725 [Tenebrio molitor]|uniref:Uncharacterized protein n=1 Tax=Tenebrio molitor TaxID=7067 RepID=A0A8J6LCZ8_TENMO|nr:hypothetical protein GEV33_006725 [Tenebrio molitor]